MKVPKPIRKHVKRANRRMYGSDKSLRHKHITLKEVRMFLKNGFESDDYSPYCPVCGSCGVYGCCSSACSLCRDDITSFTVFKQRSWTQEDSWAYFYHKSGAVWRTWND